MVKRILILFISLTACIYLYSGYHFYKKSIENRIFAVNNPIQLKPDTTKLILLKDSIVDFEIESPGTNLTLSSKYVYEGKRSLMIIPEKEYAGEFLQLFTTLPTLNFMREVDVSFMAYAENKITTPVLWIFEINSNDGRVLSWESNGVMPSAGAWQNYHFRFKIKSNLLNATYRLKTYAWNKNKNTLFVDNFHISFLGFGVLEDPI